MIYEDPSLLINIIAGICGAVLIACFLISQYGH
jgi:hypothetical protein